MRDKLTERARELGDYLRDGLLALQQRHECIGDVRGRGLLVGLDLVQDRASKAPAPELAQRVARTCLELGMMTSVVRGGFGIFRIAPADHDLQAGDRPRARNLRSCDNKMPQRPLLRNCAGRQSSKFVANAGAGGCQPGGAVCFGSVPARQGPVVLARCHLCRGPTGFPPPEGSLPQAAKSVVQCRATSVPQDHFSCRRDEVLSICGRSLRHLDFVCGSQFLLLGPDAWSDAACPRRRTK